MSRTGITRRWEARALDRQVVFWCELMRDPVRLNDTVVGATLMVGAAVLYVTKKRSVID